MLFSPGLSDLRGYHRGYLRGDLAGGLTVAAYLVPQVMAYSALAGMPPQTGLWVIAVTLVLYFLIGSSRLLSSGPESTTALLTAATLAPLAMGDPTHYGALAALLALLVGGLAVISWLLRLGFIGDLISKPVLVGYMAGVAVIMAVSQLGKVTGVDVAGDTFREDISLFITHAAGDGVSWPTIAMGFGVALILILLTPRLPILPMPLIVVALAAILTAVFHLENFGITTVGAIASAPPEVGLPTAGLPDISLLLFPAFGIFIVGYADNLLTSRMLAAGSGNNISSNREFLALGVTNLASGLIHGFPVSASASRSVIARAGGAHTQVYSLVAAALTLIVLLGLGGLLASFPTAALGGLVIYAASRLVDIPEFLRLWNFRKREFTLALAAIAAVLAFDILYGVLAAVGLSVLDLLARVARPHAAVLGQADGLAGWHDITDHPTAAQIPGLVVFRYDSPLFFANAEDFARRCSTAVTQAMPRAEWLLINMEGNVEVDITGLDSLEKVRQECDRNGIVLALTRVKHELLDDLMRHGVGERIGAEHIYPTLPTAVEAFRAWQQGSSDAGSSDAGSPG